MSSTDTPPAPGSPPGAKQAQELLGLWSSLGRQHMSMGAGCSCGIGGITLRVQDSEQDIVDYLLGDAEKGRREDVIAYLNAEGAGEEEGMWDLKRLLTGLAKQQGTPQLPEAVSAFLLERLSRTLRSFAELHGGAARG